MKTALIFAVATFGFAASVAWAADAPSRTDLPLQPARISAPAATAPSAPPSRAPTAPAARPQPVDQRSPGNPADAASGTLCACAGGNHFA